MKRKKITLNMNVQEILMLMAESNPGAINVLMSVIEEQQAEACFTMLSLDDMNIRGSQIWLGYKDFCGQDIKKFIQCVKDRDEEMIKVINKNCPDEVAVSNGASFERDR